MNKIYYLFTIYYVKKVNIVNLGHNPKKERFGSVMVMINLKVTVLYKMVVLMANRKIFKS
jgi:hypothetical protein